MKGGRMAQLQLICEQNGAKEKWLHMAMRAKTRDLIKKYIHAFEKVYGKAEILHESEVPIIKTETTAIGDFYKSSEIGDIQLLADEVYKISNNQHWMIVIFECETSFCVNIIQNKINRYNSVIRRVNPNKIYLIFIFNKKYNFEKLNNKREWMYFIALGDMGITNSKAA